MSNTKTFKSYNFVTGAVDGTLAYDFSNPRFRPQEETLERPRRRQRPQQRAVPQELEWVREDSRAETQTEAGTRTAAGFSPVTLLGTAAVVVLLVMVLLAQIRLVSISGDAVALEAQIAELETERDKLKVEYETIFNLKDVEEYATGVLGMQEPREDQIYYLTNISSADKCVIVTREQTDMFSLGVEDIIHSVKEYFS